jgi:hypothetical protein
MKRLMFLLSFVAVAGCTPAAPQSRASAAQEAACKTRADQIFQQQNRGAVYATDQYVSSTRDSPFGGAAPTSITSSLSDRYTREKMYDNCLNFGSAPEAPPTAPQP